MAPVRWLALLLGGALWAGSWYVMHKEIHRWHHVKPSLAFNYDIAPNAHPGLPLIMVYIACVAGPFLFLAGVLLLVVAR
jgi:hypothetical protein